MEDVKGNPITIQRDQINGHDYIIIKDVDGKIIFQCETMLWDGDTVCFSSETKDQILTSIRRLYG
ncbi:MAG: hypothetical protein Q7R52_02705 [archaeon]|nr:hypothetical protein [archaeon]